MSRDREWLWPLTGVAFFVILAVGLSIAPQPKDAGHPPAQIIAFFIENPC